jgi:hypothetical protein
MCKYDGKQGDTEPLGRKAGGFLGVWLEYLLRNVTFRVTR